MKHEERKQKAEQLFANMFKGMMTFEWEILLFFFNWVMQLASSQKKFKRLFNFFI